MTNDYYETLQVHPKADQEAIGAAYTRLRELYNPARLEGAADELVELARGKRDAIERAYAVLSDPQRRANYDAQLAAGEDDDAEDTDEEVLDYRPLPPARRSERSSNTQPVRRASRRAAPANDMTRPLLVVVGVLVVVALLGGAFIAFSGQNLGSLGSIDPTAVPTNSPLDQFEQDILTAQATAEQNPTQADAWISYGNMLYNSAEIVREVQPDSDLYKQRLVRWLQATDAYSRALALEPDNMAVRADYGVSSCFYGAGTNNQQYVTDGLAQVQQAAEALPDDARVLLSLGHCLVSVNPPRIPEAMEAWLKVRESQVEGSGFAEQAQQLINEYQQ